MLNKPVFNIVLHTPEIPGNTGSIGRTCLALGARLILIKPYGFDLSEKAVRRAGLDYWKHVDIKEYESWDDFYVGEDPKESDLFFFEPSDQVYYEGDYKEGCYLILGAETRGLPDEILKKHPNRLYGVPMFSEHLRSLNLSNVATTVAYEALRHIKYL